MVRMETGLLNMAWQEPLVDVGEAITMLSTAEKYLQDPLVNRSSWLLFAVIHRLARTVLDNEPVTVD